MAITHIFFDLDGTLVDSYPGIAYSAGAALKLVFPGRAAPDFLPFIGPPVREVFRRALPENDPDTLCRLEQAFRHSYNSKGWRKTTAYPGVNRTLAILHRSGMVCHVLTNKPKLPTHRILRHLSLDPFLDEIITPDSRIPAYPSKVEAALDARRRLGLATSEALVVGDSEDDSAAAAACGFPFAAVTFGYGCAYQKCKLPVDFRLDCFGSLSTLLSHQLQYQP
jgi:phosphoglycolate phosphatase